MILGCAMLSHTYYIGNACFHRAYNTFDIYHSVFLRNDPSYDKVIVSPEWQNYPVIDLYGTEIDLNASNLLDTVTNNPSCCCLGDDQFRLSIGDKFVHLAMGQSKLNFPGFLLTNADLKFPNYGKPICCPYSALDICFAAQQAMVSDGGTFVVYSKHPQCYEDRCDLIFDVIPDANKVGRFLVRYPFISFAGKGRCGGRKYFVGFEQAYNPKDEFFDIAIFRIDCNIIRYVLLPNKKILSLNSVSRQSLIDSGFVRMTNETSGGQEETWHCGTADDFVKATTCGEHVSELRITTSIFCNNGIEMKFPIQEQSLKKISPPDYIERRSSK